MDKSNQLKRRLVGAPIKDTINVFDGGYTIIRFVADNPGFWTFHCHVEFHMEIGMALTFKIGNYDQIPRTPEHFPICENFIPQMKHN